MSQPIRTCRSRGCDNLTEQNYCDECFKKKVDKFTRHKLAKLRNTIEYGLTQVKEQANPQYWVTNHANCFKCTIGKGESIKHVIVKFIRYIHHRRCGRTVFTELILKDNMGRVDLLVVDKSFIFVEEIVVSETDASITKKKDKYPFPINVVNVNKLNIINLIKELIKDGM